MARDAGRAIEFGVSPRGPDADTGYVSSVRPHRRRGFRVNRRPVRTVLAGDCSLSREIDHESGSLAPVVATADNSAPPIMPNSDTDIGAHLPGGYAAIPGPADRESFRDAQKRHRRASWRFTALSAAAIGLMGLSLSVIISPLVYAFAIVVNDLVNLLFRTPDVLQRFVDSGGSSSTDGTPVEVVVVVILALLLPGALALILSWIGVRSLLRRAGSGGAVLALGARDPAPGNLEEEQLVNVVAEIAIATGVPPPKVKLLDTPVPNAVAVGRSLDDATVIVTTGLLGKLNRDETQGAIAHVVGSVGNGDLRIGMTIASVFQTLGMVSTLLRAPTEARSRRNLWRLLRFMFWRGHRGQEAAAVADMLAQASGESSDIDSPKSGTRIRDVITLPFLMASAAFGMNDFIFMSFLVNPLIKRAWLARQYLADATAVELTRNPQGLARAVSALGQQGVVIPGAAWAGHLFFAGPENHSSPEPAVVGFHPPLARRLERLVRMGADVEVPPGGRLPLRQRPVFVIFAVLTSPFWIGFFLVMFGLAVALTGVSLMIDMLFLFPLVALLHHFLRLAAR